MVKTKPVKQCGSTCNASLISLSGQRPSWLPYSMKRYVVKEYSTFLYIVPPKVLYHATVKTHMYKHVPLSQLKVGDFKAQSTGMTV